MPMTPNDPDYKEVMERWRANLEKQKKPKSRTRNIPRGYAKSNPEYCKEQSRLSMERLKEKRLKEKLGEE